MNNNDILYLVSKQRKAIMGFCALFILFFHEYVCLFHDIRPLLLAQELVRGYGYIGVDIFFLLSGMGLVYSIEKSKLSSFYFRRFKRLVFPYIAVAIFLMIIEHSGLQVLLKRVFGIYFLLDTVYGYLWFVPAITILYFLFPFYYKLLKKQSNKLIFTGIIIVIWAILSLVLVKIIREDFYCFTNRIPIFLIGVYLGWHSKNKTLTVSKSGWIFLILLMALGMYLIAASLYFDFPRTIPLFEYSFPSVFLSIPLTFIMAKTLTLIDKCKFGKIVLIIANFYGAFSFELYCVQEYIGNMIINRLKGVIGASSLNIIVIVVVTISAYLLYLLEKAFWKLLTRK